MSHTSGHDTMQLIVSEKSAGIYLNVFSRFLFMLHSFLPRLKSIFNFMDGSGTQENSTF